MNFFKKLGNQIFFVLSFMLLGMSAANAAIDISGVTTVITDGVAAAMVIGLGFLGFKAGIAIFKQLRGAT